MIGSSSSSPLVWLADAPLFIDAEQVSALYNAVLRPSKEKAAVRLNVSGLKSTIKTGSLAEKEVPLAEALRLWFPFLRSSSVPTSEPPMQEVLKSWLRLSVETEQSGDAKSSKSDDDVVELYETSSPERQLVQLALHYFVNVPDRVRRITEPKDLSMMDPDFIEALPRALVFLDLSEDLKFIPAAAELAQGNVVTFYDRLLRAFQKDHQDKPPDRSKPGVTGEQYWNWYRERYKATPALEMVERVISDGGRAQWVDFRLPIGEDGSTLHVHINGRGQYDTGTFAYNLVKRGSKHGIRMIGTMKSEPDMNVLALYEK
jgi:hypothetical protein